MFFYTIIAGIRRKMPHIKPDIDIITSLDIDLDLLNAVAAYTESSYLKPESYNILYSLKAKTFMRLCHERENDISW